MSGRHRKDNYPGLTNAQKYTFRRDKLKQNSGDFMLKEKVRKRKWRANIRKDPAKYKKYKEDEKLTKWVAKKPKQANNQMTIPQPNDKNSSTANNSPPNSGSSLSCKQTLYYSVTRTDCLFPLKNPNKKTEVIQRLLTKYKLRINLRKIKKKQATVRSSIPLPFA